MEEYSVLGSADGRPHPGGTVTQHQGMIGAPVGARCRADAGDKMRSFDEALARVGHRRRP